jgi:3',5'-cyclic AMP phosphodiesterase CpdA
MNNYTSQIQIIHLSDIHFGEYHICNPPKTGSDAGLPTLSTLIANDLQRDFTLANPDYPTTARESDCPLIMAISGDFTQRALHNEFLGAFKFITDTLSQKLLNRTIERKNLFMVPGNHDVQFAETYAESRFQPYCSFYDKVYEHVRPNQAPHRPLDLTQIHMRNEQGNKFMIAEINCCMYVEKDTVDSSRGQVDFQALEKLTNELKKLKQEHEDFDEYIKIAMIHHHVVLLPSFIEDGRGVDSIMNAGYLLELLSEFNFHLILHGHKHYPQIFNYEPIPLWSESRNAIPQVIIAGGSCGSSELNNNHEKACNTYSVITIKWHPGAKQARIKVITRGLKRKSLPPYQWSWSTVNISDKVIAPYRTIPNTGMVEKGGIVDDSFRRQEYARRRLYMPVIEVMPSLIPGQAYEVRGWITEHKPELPRPPQLAIVEWSAGEKFPTIVCHFADNPNFSFAYHYWSSMLIQAKLIFADGEEVLTYLYARMPKDEQKKLP